MGIGDYMNSCGNAQGLGGYSSAMQGRVTTTSDGTFLDDFWRAMQPGQQMVSAFGRRDNKETKPQRRKLLLLTKGK